LWVLIRGSPPGGWWGGTNHLPKVTSGEQPARNSQLGLVVRTIGLARARTKIGLANLVHNMRRLLWRERQATPA
jgi:hypothetical protein